MFYRSENRLDRAGTDQRALTQRASYQVSPIDADQSGITADSKVHVFPLHSDVPVRAATVCSSECGLDAARPPGTAAERAWGRRRLPWEATASQNAKSVL